MLRSELRGAPYNPRTITAKARKQLKAGLEALGLLHPLTWNKRTGNLVAGHQRLDLLDGLANGASDYKLTVAVVDLSPEEEIEANVLLNNPEAAGRYDLPKLGELLKTKGVRVAATGFSLQDVHRVLGEGPLVALAAKRDEKKQQQLAEALGEYSKHFEGQDDQGPRRRR